MSPPAVNLLIQDRHVVIYNYILFCGEKLHNGVEID